MNKAKNEWKKIWSNTGFTTDFREIMFEPFAKDLLKLFKTNNKVLEAGCGLGRYCVYLKRQGLNIYGIDIVREVIRKAKILCRRSKLNINFRTGNVCRLPYRSNFFDGYISLGVIEHFEKSRDVRKCFSEAYRVLKPGGIAYFAIPNFLSPHMLYFRLLSFFGVKNLVTHYPLSQSGLISVGEKTNFTIIETRKTDFYYPWYLVARKILRKDNWFIKRNLMRFLNPFDKIPLINQFCTRTIVVFSKT